MNIRSSKKLKKIKTKLFFTIYSPYAHRKKMKIDHPNKDSFEILEHFPPKKN